MGKSRLCWVSLSLTGRNEANPSAKLLEISHRAGPDKSRVALSPAAAPELEASLQRSLHRPISAPTAEDTSMFPSASLPPAHGAPWAQPLVWWLSPKHGVCFGEGCGEHQRGIQSKAGPGLVASRAKAPDTHRMGWEHYVFLECLLVFIKMKPQPAQESSSPRHRAKYKLLLQIFI